MGKGKSHCLEEIDVRQMKRGTQRMGDTSGFARKEDV
jgi:hypothetical protein